MDFSWSEMMLVGIVALIVIGPKDLPGMFRELGRITAKIRSMGREFSRAMEQAAKESGVKEATDSLKTLTNPVGTGLNAVKSAADKFEKWDPVKNAAKPSTPAPAPAVAPMTPSPAPAQAVAVPVETPAAGPATQALIDKQAARKAIMDEMNAKLKALDAGDAPAAAQPAKAPGRRRKAKGDEA